MDGISAGMSSAGGDYDNDGWMDLYIGNMYSGAGNRIAYQQRFAEETGPETHSLYKRHAAGNSLFREPW